LLNLGFLDGGSINLLKEDKYFLPPALLFVHQGSKGRAQFIEEALAQQWEWGRFLNHP